jgi:GT2 family glycosyltransferase
MSFESLDSAEIYPAADISPRGAVIVLTYNQKEFPFDCLQSLRECLPSDVSVVLVDNCSPENLALFYKGHFPWVHCIRSSVNAGYAAGNNLGAAYAIQRGARLVYCLNDDTVVKPGFWEECERWVDERGASIVGSVILQYSKPHLMQEAGVRFDRSSLTPTYRGVDAPYDASISGYYSCDAVCGAGLMVTAEAFSALGGLDESFVIYFEETDLCLRARDAGLEVGIAGESLILHKGGATMGVHSPRSVYHFLRNRLWFGRRHSRSARAKVAYLLRSIPRYAAGVCWYALKRREAALVRSVVNAVADGVLGAPPTPPKERTIEALPARGHLAAPAMTRE